MFTLLLLYYYIIFFMYSNNLEGRQGSDLIQYSTPWEYKPTNKQTNKHAPWYISALRQEKRVRRRSERVAARTMLEVDRHIGYVQEAK